ncbi:MAG: molybdopterin oxidoreductase family protein [Gammaproteobacteria bacterium]|nr:molybdopterin oxidoreductase family protein [Gammaproteobacteria bacterium]
MSATDPSASREIELSRPIGDEVKTTTCYMCACRCGIKVHLSDGKVRYIEGNPDHPVNKGVLCAKGSAGIMQHYSPARLSKPLLRVGERGSGEFKEIEWDEALELAVSWLDPIRKSDPRKLAFFTGRDQSQALTGWWASQFGTPNYAAHGGFCSVNMAAGGLYSIGGSFWEFGEPDWEHTRYFMMFGVAEDHDSNPIKMGLSKLKSTGAKFVSVNPIRTGYSAIADEWVGITPGSDGLFALALAHELLRSGNVDVKYLATYTNAPWLVIDDPGADDHGLFARDADGNPLCWDRERQMARSAMDPDTKPTLQGQYKLPDGRDARPAFEIMAERYLDPKYSPAAVAERTGLTADKIQAIAAEIAQVAFSETVVIEQPWTDALGRRHERMEGRPVSMHAMRGISAHSNGFQTCRTLHLVQMLLGTIDVPGGFRYKPPFPKPIPPPQLPAGKPSQLGASTPMPGPPLGFPAGPEDLLVDANGNPNRIDKAFSWEAPIAAHGMMHTVIANAVRGDPYPVDTLFMYMANMAWNSSMNTAGTIDMLTERGEDGEYKIPHIIYSDAYASETVGYADLVLPDTTYLERWDCISIMDRPISSAEGPADSIRQPVLQPDRDVRPFQDVLIDIGTRLQLPGLLDADGAAKYPGGYADFLVNHEYRPGVGSLAGWRGKSGESTGVGEPFDKQLEKYVENGCFWSENIPEEGIYFKHFNRTYLDYAVERGFIPKADPIVLQIYSEPLQRFRLAGQGKGPMPAPEAHRGRLREYFDPLPDWFPPFSDEAELAESFPVHALTQRPAAMYHSWGSQNAWLRQLHASNCLYIPESLAQEHDLSDDDWAWLESNHARIRVQVKVMQGVNGSTVWTWNAIGKRKGAWRLSDDAPESQKGFLLNHLIKDLLPVQPNGHRYANADPITGQAAWYDLRVRIIKAGPEEEAVSQPQFVAMPPLPNAMDTGSLSDYGAQFAAKPSDKQGGD